jgi:hypothetical protein
MLQMAKETQREGLNAVGVVSCLATSTNPSQKCYPLVDCNVQQTPTGSRRIDDCKKRRNQSHIGALLVCATWACT